MTSPRTPFFLSGKREGSKRGLPQLFNRGSCKVEAGRSNEELDILEAKRILVVVSVFAWAEKEEESNDDHVDCRAEDGEVGVRCLGEDSNMTNNCNWDGFDSEWSGVGLFPGF